MATITGTGGNDVLDSTLLEDDIIQGIGGNDLYRYYLTSWDDTITDTGGNDTIQFDSPIDYKAFALLKDGDDLYIDLQDSGKIIVEDHFLSSNDQIETLQFLSGYTFDLTASNLIIAERGNTISPSFNNPNGTSANDLIFVGVGQEYYTDYYASNKESNATAAGAGDDIIFANYAEYVWAGTGNDTVYGYSRNVYLGEGNDKYYGADREDFTGSTIGVYGGSGDDEIHGTNQKDALRGDHDDYGSGVIGIEGDDVIYGYGGNDTLMGGGGNDTLYGGDGDDDVIGEDGNDTLYGGDGNDIINTGNGDNIAYGGDGNDDIFASTGNGNNVLYGEGGDDTIQDGLGDDQLYGGHGDDNLRATTGSDILDAGAGNDHVYVLAEDGEVMTVSAGSGHDFITMGIYAISSGQPIGTYDVQGSFGNDDYHYNISNGVGSYHDIGTSTVYDSGGNDDSLLMRNAVLSDFIFSVSGNNLVLTSNNFVGSITVVDHFSLRSHIEHFQFGYWDHTNNMKVVTSEFSLIENLTNNVDTYTASSTTSPIGSDRNIIDGLNGDDVIYAGTGGDIIYAGSGNDTLYGEDGDDILIGEVGINALYGGNGNDVFYGGLGQDTMNGGDGVDTADYSASTTFVHIDLVYNNFYGGHADGDTLISIENIIGTNTHDRDYLFGDVSDNEIYGLNGNDFLQGDAGADLIDGGTGWDYAMYSRSDAAVTINLATNVNTGGHAQGDILVNIEAIIASSYDDHITGSASSDYLRGEDGNDTLIGGAGNDTLIGGSGNDTLDGGDGVDTADYNASLAAVNIDLLHNNASGGDAAGDTLISIESLIGSDVASERDYLFGDDGTNVLSGLAGNDFLQGGAGADVIDGGAGWDYAMYSRSDAAVNIDLITNSNTGGHAEGDTLTNIEAIIASSYDDVLSGSTGNDYFRGEDGNDTLYGVDGHDTLYGGNGDDVLYGGQGNDNLYGQGGADTFVFEGADAFVHHDNVHDLSLAEGDKLDISDLISGYDPVTDAISDFVQITDNGTHSELFVDADGGADNFVKVADLLNVTGLTDEDALEASGNLVTV